MSLLFTLITLIHPKYFQVRHQAAADEKGERRQRKEAPFVPFAPFLRLYVSPSSLLSCLGS